MATGSPCRSRGRKSVDAGECVVDSGTHRYQRIEAQHLEDEARVAASARDRIAVTRSGHDQGHHGRDAQVEAGRWISHQEKGARLVTGRLLSVNVGGPREVAWQGKTVRTAIWKAPVEGPRMVRRINIDGDDQADRVAHGGEHRAVFVYQVESYRYWEHELGRDDFAFGQFGENLTVEGMADDEVCIGDRFRIAAAEFEVTQPRVTCYRVGIRLDNPRMPTLLVAHHRPGFYLRVLKEGPVEAGEEIVRIARGAERMTIADTDALLYLPGRSPETLRRALEIPALSPGWRDRFEALLSHPGGSAAPPPAWAGSRPMRLAAKQRESEAIVSLYLLPADDTPVASSTPAGQ